MKDIDYQLRKHLKTVEEKYPGRVMFIAAVGSMNYGTFSEESDVDTKAIIIPTFESLVFDKPESTTLHIEDEQCSVKDIRTYIHELKKQGISSLETLVTDYFLENYAFGYYVDYLRSLAEDICHYNEHNFVKSASGDLIHKSMRWNKEYSEYLKTNNDSNLCYKDAYNVVRLHDTIERYLKGMKFKYTIDCGGNLNRDFLLRVKHGELGPQGTNDLVSYCCKNLPELSDCEVDRELESKLNTFTLNIIKETINEIHK